MICNKQRLPDVANTNENVPCYQLSSLVADTVPRNRNDRNFSIAAGPPRNQSRRSPIRGFAARTLPLPLEPLADETLRKSSPVDTFAGPAPTDKGFDRAVGRTGLASVMFSFSSNSSLEQTRFLAGCSIPTSSSTIELWLDLSSNGVIIKPEAPASSLPRHAKLKLRLRSASLIGRSDPSETDIQAILEERFGVLAATFRSEGVIPTNASSSSSVGDSTGVGRSESGRFWRVGRRAAGAGALTGEGLIEGSFSFEAEASSSKSSPSESTSGSAGGVGSMAKCGRFRLLRSLDPVGKGPESSPRRLAAPTGALRAAGMRAWMEVINFA